MWRTPATTVSEKLLENKGSADTLLNHPHNFAAVLDKCINLHLCNFPVITILSKVEEEFVFRQSAFKHGIVEPDIRNAFKQRMFDYAMHGEEHKNLLLGLARDGSLLEIMYNVLNGSVINVFHAMKCRKAYMALLRIRGIE